MMKTKVQNTTQALFAKSKTINAEAQVARLLQSCARVHVRRKFTDNGDKFIKAPTTISAVYL